MVDSSRFYTPQIYEQPYFSQESKIALLKTIPTFTEGQIYEITAYINNYRAVHQAPPLIWDGTISHFAQKWSTYLLNNNIFQHSGSDKYGENLAYLKGYGTDIMALMKLSVDMWYNEVKLYDFKKAKFSQETAHFTALIWKSSISFGMGITVNPDIGAADITMNLSPPGNLIGEFDKNVFEATAPTSIIIVPDMQICRVHLIYGEKMMVVDVKWCENRTLRLLKFVKLITSMAEMNGIPLSTGIVTFSVTNAKRDAIPLSETTVFPMEALEIYLFVADAQLPSSNNIILKANIIHSLYNLINKSKDEITHDISQIIIDIVKL